MGRIGVSGHDQFGRFVRRTLGGHRIRSAGLLPRSFAAATSTRAIALANSNPYGNGTAVVTSSGESARRFQRGVKVGMIDIDVPIPVPMACYSFGGWNDSLFGDKHVHGPEGVSFYTRAKVVTSRCHVSPAIGASFHFPTNS